ncbi:helix-turn-helix domain-containing protein [Streptomyces lydicus]|uniref:helix-turn-helix domain-containing protein n=1 Tax=Streptomyces lydicus TaxID=47763 RepID=UPI0037877192
MNTTAAATEANVTAATIRNWCRKGVIAATKQAGKWVIDTASLAHRITIGQLKRPATKVVAFTIETMTAIGGNRWQRNGVDRVYINDWARFAGIEIERYRSGSISSASIGGRGIANIRAARLLDAIDKIYFDATDGQLYAQHHGADDFEIRYLNGERDTINLVQRLFSGIRTAIAAL